MAHSGSSRRGDVVAFEGPPDVVATQLRLLPPSPQLMVLPSVESYMSPAQLDQKFNAKDFVKRIQQAYAVRDTAAQTFISDSITGNNRLVFVSGGRPAARRLCIQGIMEHETGGDRAKAESLFESILRDGAAGLNESPLLDHGHVSSKSLAGHDDFMEDPTIKAMRAADALYRETAALQPSGGLAASRPRSLSLPLYGFSNEVDESTPFYMFGVPQSRRESTVGGDDRREDVGDIYATFDASETSSTTTPRAEQDKSPSTVASVAQVTLDRNSEARRRTSAVTGSPVSESFSLISTDNVVFGEAALLDVRVSVARQSVSRVKSLDRIYPLSPKLRDLGIPAGSWLAEPETPISLKPHPLGSTKSEREAALTALTSTEKPRTVQVKTRLPEVRLQPAPPGKKRRKISDPGSDQASDDQAWVPTPNPSLQEAEVEHIFAGSEEIIILFEDEDADPILHSTIQALKNEGHPMLSHSPTESDSTRAAESAPSTPGKRLSNEDKSSGREPAILSPSADEYDPFAYTQAPWQPPRASRIVTKTKIVRPPTPAQTPPPQTPTTCSELRVREIKISEQECPVSVQNSLRLTLEELFPPSLGSYHRFQFVCSPAQDVLWSPLFQLAKSQAEGHGLRQSPEILAIGSRNSVPCKTANSIISNMEYVCRGSSERVVTRRIDILYLLGNAFQAFSTQRLANQAFENPFDNKHSLAALVVPQLETFLALHPEVRYLLLTYPHQHLATVLAMQKLMGSGFMKIAQIAGSQKGTELPFRRISSTSLCDDGDGEVRSSPNSPGSHSDTDTSPTNYLLASTANEHDIAKFVSVVWHIQARASSRDAGSDDPNSVKTTIVQRRKPLPLAMKGEPLSPFPKVMPQSPLSPDAPRISGPGLNSPVALNGLALNQVTTPTSAPPAPVPESTPAEETGQITTVVPRSEKEARDEVIVDYEYRLSEDSSDDMEERRLMPMIMQKRALRRPNSRKALKFLGLA